MKGEAIDELQGIHAITETQRRSLDYVYSVASYYYNMVRRVCWWSSLPAA